MERQPREIRHLTLDWTQDQKTAFSHMKEVRPDLADIVTKARDVLFSANKHDPHDVAQSRNVLNAWGMMPSVYEIKNDRKP